MQISPGIHAVKIPFQIPVAPDVNLDRFVYAYLIDSGRLCLIDSGVAGSESHVFDELKGQGRAPSDIDYLFLTHCHPDHIGAAKEIKAQSNCSVWSHPAAQTWVEDVEKQYSVRPVPGFHKLVSGSVSVNRLFEDNAVIDLGRESLQIIYTPGHSECSVTLFCTNSGLLFTGDAIPQGNDLPIYDDVAKAVNSIGRLKKVDGVRHILSSWSDPSLEENPQEILDRGLLYFQKIHSVVRDISINNHSIDPMDLCREVVKVLQLPKLAVNPLVARSLYSHMPLVDKEML